MMRAIYFTQNKDQFNETLLNCSKHSHTIGFSSQTSPVKLFWLTSNKAGSMEIVQGLRVS